MPKQRETSPTRSQRRIKPARTPEARESQMVALAIDLAEKQLRDGTASSQIIAILLKLATTRDRLEREILERQKDLIEAKTESLQAAKRMDGLYEEAIAAFRRYNGESDDPDE